MASGRPIEDELLAAAIVLQTSPEASWDARELFDQVEEVLAGDVHPVTVQRNLRRFVKEGWVVETPSVAQGRGRPRKLYRLEPAGLAAAQRAAARLVGAGADWALAPLGRTFN